MFKELIHDAFLLKDRDKYLYKLGVKLCPSAFLKFFYSLAYGECFSIWPVSCHCAERICYSYYPCTKGNVFPSKTFRITCAVVTLLVVLYYLCCMFQWFNRFDYLSAVCRMFFNNLHFLFRKFTRLHENMVRNRYLPYIMQKGCFSDEIGRASCRERV